MIRTIVCLPLVLTIVVAPLQLVGAFQPFLSLSRSSTGNNPVSIFLPSNLNERSQLPPKTATFLEAVPGADIEQPPLESAENIKHRLASSSATGSISSTLSTGSNRKGKVNEIDFCIAPADASLSRAYGTYAGTKNDNQNKKVPSLTRALNNASNRAVRRILLARSWPSAEALNLSLRRVAAAEREASLKQQQTNGDSPEGQEQATTAINDTDPDAPKCPVPRPILNVLTRKSRTIDVNNSSEGGAVRKGPTPRSRTDEEYVADQIVAFRERYGSLPGYDESEAYLDSILSLATSGVESVRATEVLESGIYDDAYRRIDAVLRTVGVEFETDATTGRRKIAPKLVDQDICLSMLDKINIRKEQTGHSQSKTTPTSALLKEQSSAEVPSQEDESDKKEQMEEGDDENLNGPEGVTEFKLDGPEDVTIVRGEDGVEVYKPNLQFWKRKSEANSDDDPEIAEDTTNVTAAGAEGELTPEDLGGVLLSAEEPTMTRQLNVLSNIVRRALLFGGEQELLVLSETLDADRAAFVERWYSGTGGSKPLEAETRPGVQFLNALISLLRNCYNEGIVVDMEPPLPLGQSYANAYERLVATAVELGSGYLKPDPSADLAAMPTPRTPKEELGRFAVLETTFRQQKYQPSAYPEDLVGEWEVTDLIGGETIGECTVQLSDDGKVELEGPLEGLRWRCDPGPTHLDTVVFQVIGSDGTILQYRGFVDRGSRLESKISKRPIKIRGKVMFQMRDGSIDYFKDMLPINYREGTTRFVMTKIVEER